MQAQMLDNGISMRIMMVRCGDDGGDNHGDDDDNNDNN